MATFVKFDSFITEMAAGTHAGWLNADTDVVRAYLSNTTPDVAADSVKADLAEISTGNGYTGAVDVQNAASQSGGTITVTATDFTVTASGGSVGPFRYVVFYNDSAPNDELIGYYDYGSEITLADTQSFTVDFGASFGSFS